eukprot:scaffold188813_cov36-Prasinocladus_malaysianus.AAC.1
MAVAVSDGETLSWHAMSRPLCAWQLFNETQDVKLFHLCLSVSVVPCTASAQIYIVMILVISLIYRQEGLPTIFLAFAIRFLLPDSPRSSEFLLPAERQWLR